MLDDLRQRIGGADRRSVARSLGLSILGLATATGVVSLLQSASIGVRDASPVYLVVVVLVGPAAGTGTALWTAVTAFVAYDFLFTEPRCSLAVADPQEWLELVLFLVVAVVVGRLSASSAERGLEATRRAVVAGALFSISRRLAVAPNTAEAASEIVGRLATARRRWASSRSTSPRSSSSA